MNVQLANTYDPAKSYNTDFWYATRNLTALGQCISLMRDSSPAIISQFRGSGKYPETLEAFCTERGLVIR